MVTVGGVVVVSTTLNEENELEFAEVLNTTDGKVSLDAGEGQFTADGGTYQIVFVTTNSSFDTSPISFPNGEPSWLGLDDGDSSGQITITFTNDNHDTSNQVGVFHLHVLPEGSGTEPVVGDPTVVNNPIEGPPVPPVKPPARVRA